MKSNTKSQAPTRLSPRYWTGIARLADKRGFCALGHAYRMYADEERRISAGGPSGPIDWFAPGLPNIEDLPERLLSRWEVFLPQKLVH